MFPTYNHCAHYTQHHLQAFEVACSHAQTRFFHGCLRQARAVPQSSGSPRQRVLAGFFLDLVLLRLIWIFARPFLLCGKGYGLLLCGKGRKGKGLRQRLVEQIFCTSRCFEDFNRLPSNFSIILFFQATGPGRYRPEQR